MATQIALGMPALPPPVLAPRRKTRQIKVGSVAVGGGAQISVQSMTTTLTSDVNATLQQIAALTAAGCDIVRVAVPTQDDADTQRQRDEIRALKERIAVLERLATDKEDSSARLDREIEKLRDRP